jgi:hypothetical protein
VHASLIYFDGCPHWQLARTRIQHAIDYAGVGRVDVDLVRVASHDEAITYGLCGSPTILIDGTDPFADPNLELGLSCRIYETEHGPDGAPSVTQLVEALRRAGNSTDPQHAVDEASFPASDPPEQGAPGL